MSDTLNADAPNNDTPADAEALPKVDEQLLLETLDAIRPSLVADGGDIEFRSVDDEGVVSVKLTGSCAGCPLSSKSVMWLSGGRACAMTLDQIYHSLDPVALSLGPISIRWYGIAYLLGFILGGVVLWRTARRWKLGLTLDDVSTLIVGIAFGVIVGGRLGYCLFYGMSFHGGLVGAIIGGAIVCRQLGLSFRTMCDLGVIAAPLGLFFGRCANFVNGELWGKPCDLPWAVTFETGGAIPRHPSQLYEALLEGLVIFCVLQVVSRRKKTPPQGTFMGLFLLMYGVFRFLIEFVRVPDAQLGYLISGVVTMGQLLSLPLVLLGIVELVLAHRRGWRQRGHVGDAA